jgi:hypothetical protein
VARFPQLKATKGSQKCIQVLINEKPHTLNLYLRQNLELLDDEEIRWLSPLKDDYYAEYRDQAVIERLGVNLPSHLLDEFWPKGGPQWDALGKSTLGKLFLVEAKSHISELISSCGAKDPNSIAKIQESLRVTKDKLGAKTDFDWSKTFYQYANRLAHVNFLKQHGLPAYFVSVYFLNDLEMNGPKTEDEWKGAIRLVHRCLGLREHLLQKWIINLYVDVSKL